MSAPVPQPHEILWSLTNAVVASRSLHVIAELGVADQIDDEPVRIEELAAACGADPDGLDRVLRLLAAFGIFAGIPTATGTRRPPGSCAATTRCPCVPSPG